MAHQKVTKVNISKVGKAHPATVQPVEQSTKMTYKGMGSGSVTRKGVKPRAKRG